jgi:Tol biopolymer transport system component
MEIAVVDLSTGEHRVLLQGVQARWSPTGHILVVREDGALLAAPFDDRTLEVTGPAIPLLEGVEIEGQGTADLVLSENGTLAYASGTSQGNVNQLVWVSRSGGIEEIDPDWRGAFFAPRLSPDGNRLAVGILEGAERQIWIKQLDQGPLSKLSFQGTFNSRANWRPDGQAVVFRSNRGASMDLYTRRADGSAQAELLMDDDLDFNEVIYSPDGEWLIYRGGADLFAQRLASDEAPVALATGDFFDGHADVSPDGRWLAYVSDESGRPEVYVHPFPNTGDARWQISSEGGMGPAWAHSGRELFYVSPDQQMMSVDVLPGSTFIAGDRRALFSVQPFSGGVNTRSYDVAPDDDRFVMIRPAPDAGLGQIVVVENFFEELLRRMGG